MNRYEWKMRQRRDRLETRAARLRAKGQEAIKRADQMASVIPFGQPILVGHHSEGRDRRYRARIHNTLDRGFALQREAVGVSRQAEAVGTGGISSDDPDAIAKLTNELAPMRILQAKMKEANAIVRKFSADKETGCTALERAGFSTERAAALFDPDFCGRVGFPSYVLANNNANIRRIEQRIRDLEQAALRTDRTIQAVGFEIVHNTTENRVQLVFTDKPEEEILKLLKTYGFKWAPSCGAWQRQLNNAGIWNAELVADKIKQLKESNHD